MRIETPRGRVIRQGNSRVVLEWNSGFQNQWQGQYSAAQVFVDNEVLRLSTKYLPFQSGFLQKSGILGTIPGKGEVVWNSPYARYLYYGKVMVGVQSNSPWARLGERKILTGRDLTYNGAPMRGKMWFERMKQNHKAEILHGASKRATGGNR